jgi:hypothetical protein
MSRHAPKQNGPVSWSDNDSHLWCAGGLDEFRDTLRSHSLVIGAICPNESSRLVLEQALADFPRKIGIRRLSMSHRYSVVYGRPVRPRFEEMYRVL